MTYFVFFSILTPYQSDRLSRLHSEGHVLKNLHAAHKHTHKHTKPKHIFQTVLLSLVISQILTQMEPFWMNKTLN